LLGALLAFRVKGSRNKRLTKFARRAVEDAGREVDKRRGTSDEDTEALHRLRLAYKRLRYTTETFADVLPLDLGALARTAAGFQKRIGEVHDLEVVEGSVRHARTLPDPTKQALLSALTELRVKHEASLFEELGWRKADPGDQLSGSDSLRKISIR
jgi:CHAD domain-containing protein